MTDDPALTVLCAPDQLGTLCLSIVATRHYTFVADGRCRPTEEQPPLVLEPRIDEDQPLRLARDLDAYGGKPATDLVIQGHAYNPAHRPEFGCGVQIGDRGKAIRVFGDRNVELVGGALRFSDPEPREQIPLSYAYAYGGHDALAAATAGEAIDPLRPHMREQDAEAAAIWSVFAYPRNPIGRGWLIEPTAEAVEQLRLPNLEDPADLLTPETLAVGHPGRWVERPLPQACEWIDHGWFPRCAFWGIVPPYVSEATRALECTRFTMPDDLLDEQHPPEGDPRASCGTALDLQFPYLRGDETVTLHALSPHTQRLDLRLPGERPRLELAPRAGKILRLKPLLQTVLIEPDTGRLTLVWRGSTPCRRRYLAEELAAMPRRALW
ncbi:MAG: DUF2169 family type VI secretion system accessory protein [Planctomycetota bacterium]